MYVNEQVQFCLKIDWHLFFSDMSDPSVSSRHKPRQCFDGGYES